MQKKTLFRRTVAVLLSALMLLSVLPMTAFAAIDLSEEALPKDSFLISKTNYNVAPGIEETQFIVNNASGTRQNMCYAVTVQMGGSASVIASYKNQDGTKPGLQSVRDQAAAAESKRGYNVVAGVNADIFNMQTGAPYGFLVMDGVQYYNNEKNLPYFAILKDGTAAIREAGVSTDDVKEAVGLWCIFVQDGKNTAVQSGSYDMTDQPRTAVGIKADGSVVLFVNDGRQFPKSSGLSWSETADMMISLGCVIAGNLDGGGSTTFISQHEGEDGLTCRNSPSDGSERPVSSALLVTSSAKPTGVFDHASLAPNNEIYTPGSSVQFVASGVDSSGAAVALPEDGTFALADDSFGEIDADGLFVSSGKTGIVTVNYLSGGNVCGSVSIEIADPDTLYVPNSEISLGFEETTDFAIVAKSKDRTVNMKPGDLVWTMTDDEGKDISTTAGTFDGLTFTTFDGVTVNANVTATYFNNSAVKAQIRAIIGAMPVVLYDFEYTTDKEEADANPDLEWIPSYVMPTFDRTTGVSSVNQAAAFYEQGYPLYNWPNAALSDQQSMKSRIVSKADGEPVRFGEHSYRIDYSYATYNGSSNANNYVRVTTPDHAFDGSPTAIGAWVYIPEGTANFALYLNCANQCDDPENGYNLAYAAVTGSDGIDWTGWRYVEFNLNDPSNSGAGPAKAPFGFYQGCGVFWISYQPGGPKGDKTASTIYLDNIQLVYGANTDDIDNPLISSIRTDETEIADGETVLNSNVNTFKASYSDFDGKYATGVDFSEVKMLLDGVDVTDRCYINEGDEEIYLYDASLANGPHAITISVSDLFGNTTEETRSFTVNGNQENTAVVFSALDEAPVLGSDYTLAITANDAADVTSADVSLKVLSYFVKYWNDFRVELNPNYVLAGAASYDDTNSTINFKAVRSDSADPSLDDGIIAKVIISIPNDVPEGLAVTYRVDKGALTFASEKDASFCGSFYGKVETTCIAPLIITCDTMLVGSVGGNIHVADRNGKGVERVYVYTTLGEYIGVTDAKGNLFTDRFVGAVAEFSIYAQNGDQLSFVYSGQSYPSGGTADGMPSFIKLNACKKPSTQQSISWMSSPLAAGNKAVVLYASRADYEEKGADALVSFIGKSQVVEMASSALAATNYAVRINSAVLTGLTPNTEYVYFVGDGENMTTEPKTFDTCDTNVATNFFVIGDTQATDTTNTDQITSLLAASGIDFEFGIQTGDAVDNGGNYTMWANIAKVFSGDFLGSQDLVQVLGNHEYYGNEGTASNAAAYFNLPDTSPEGAAPNYYSVEYGNVYVAVINYAGLETYRRAAQWLVEDAANSDADWKILTMHQPAYYTNPGGNSKEMQEIISGAVDAANIDFVFSGHDHSYARTAPLTNGEVDEADGAVYFICGSTGEKSYDIVNTPEHHFVSLNEDYNAIYLTVSATDSAFDVTVHEYTADGQDVILDSYTRHKDITCTEDGKHAFDYDNGNLICSVCGYKQPVGNYTGFITELASDKTIYLYLGAKKTNSWLVVGDDTYYLDENGYLATGEFTVTEAVQTARPESIPDILFNGEATALTYRFAEDGKLLRGAVVEKNGAKYYVYAGIIQFGWYNIDGDWYYFDGVKQEEYYGKALTGNWTRNSQRYVSDADGKLQKGFLFKDEGGTKYFWAGSYVIGWYHVDGVDWDNKSFAGGCYFDPENLGYMVTGEKEIDGVMYYFNPTGTLKNGVEEDEAGIRMYEGGLMVSGWKEIDGYKYYFDPANGNYMATGNVTIDGVMYAFHEDGTFAHDGAHEDADEDGNCDLCQKETLNFVEKILALFTSIFTAIKTMMAFFK